MGLLESALLSLCVGSTGQANLACNNAVQAGSKQSGFEQVTTDYENHQMKLYEKDADSWLGKDNANTVGGAAWLGYAVATRRARIDLPNLGLCDKISLEADRNESKLVLKWIW
jgi:hypothetical protein